MIRYSQNDAMATVMMMVTMVVVVRKRTMMMVNLHMGEGLSERIR